MRARTAATKTELNDGAGAAEPGRSKAHPGLALRAIRKERGLTLAAVAKLTGLPVSTLSKVENEKTSLSYGSLRRISEGLEIDIALLFAGASPDGMESALEVVPVGRRSITRAGEGSEIETPSYRHLYPVSDLVNKKIIPIFAEPNARTMAEFGDYIRHKGEEYALVIEGVIEFHCEYYTPVVLKKGDSLYFDSSMGHAYLRASDGPCILLSVCTG